MAQGPIRILVVNDERNIRKSLCRVLEAAGYKVDTGGDGDDDLIRLREEY